MLAIAAVGAAYFVAKQTKSTTIHPLVAEYHIGGSLGITLTPVMQLVSEHRMRPILKNISELLKLMQCRDPLAQWSVSKKVHEVCVALEHVCEFDAINSTDAELRDALYVKDDIVPEVIGHIDDMMHNFLLDMR